MTVALRFKLLFLVLVECSSFMLFLSYIQVSCCTFDLASSSFAGQIMSSSSALITPALRGACRSAMHAFSSHHSSSSSAGGRMVTGTHLLRIESYPLLRKKVVTGKAITSAAFNVGGKEWRFHYYPNGVDSDTAGSVCVALELTSKNRIPWDVVAEYKVDIISRDGKPAWYGCDVPPYHFNSSMRGYCVEKLGLLRWLAPWFLHDDDCLNVQCDISVLELDTADVFENKF